MNPTCVCLLSGGMDSAALLYWLKRRGEEPFCLAVNYGQKAQRELDAARRLAEIAGVDFLWLPLGYLGRVAPSALTDPKASVPRPEEGARARTIVPFRNAHLLLWGATIAAKLGAERVFYGATQEDAALYPDCREPFVLAFSGALSLGLPADQEARLQAPWCRLSKLEVLREGLELGVPYALTWSCYAASERPCRACDAGASRAAAWAEVGLPDPALQERP